MKYFISIIISVFFFQTEPVESIIWSRNLETSMKNAEEHKKPVFIYFGASWCGPCKRMEKMISSDKDFIDFSKKIEMVKIYDDYAKGDIEKYNYFNLTKKKYSVESIPTIIFIKNDKKPLYITGFYEPKTLIKTINSYN